jgi:hypothetical protein
MGSRPRYAAFIATLKRCSTQTRVLMEEHPEFKLTQYRKSSGVGRCRDVDIFQKSRDDL